MLTTENLTIPGSGTQAVETLADLGHPQIAPELLQILRRVRDLHDPSKPINLAWVKAALKPEGTSPKPIKITALYRVLGVRVDASFEEIELAFRRAGTILKRELVAARQEAYPKQSDIEHAFTSIEQAYLLLRLPEIRARFAERLKSHPDLINRFILNADDVLAADKMKPPETSETEANQLRRNS